MHVEAGWVHGACADRDPDQKFCYKNEDSAHAWELMFNIKIFYPKKNIKI